MVKECVLQDGKICNECGECDKCDLDSGKICNNCGRCLEEGKDSNAVLIEGIDMEGFWEGDWAPEETNN